jgi:hypothetical protein
MKTTGPGRQNEKVKAGMARKWMNEEEWRHRTVVNSGHPLFLPSCVLHSQPTLALLIFK